jgi:Icc protein
MKTEKKMSRRKFIETTATTLAAVTVASSFVGFRPLSTKGKAGSLKFIHVTDSHLDLGKPQTIKWLEMMVKKVNADYPSIDFVLFGGDNFNNNAPGFDDANTFKKIADKLKCPWYAVRGNKESNPKPEGDPLNQKDFAKMFFPSDVKVVGRDWKLDKGRYTILGIDTTIEKQNNGVYTPETLAFVEKELKENPDRSFIILNHQVYSNFWKGTKEGDLHKYVLNNVKEVKKRLFGYPNLLLTLSGHKHLNNVAKSKSVTEVATLGFVVPQDQNNKDDHRFRYIEINDNKITQKIVSIV